MTFETITASGAIETLPSTPGAFVEAKQSNRASGRPAGPVLVVNDMQPQFKAACSLNLLAAVQVLIESAKANKQAIIVVEYDPLFEGKTHKCLLDSLVGYEHVAFATKHLDRIQMRRARGERNLPHNADDGSEQIIDACLEHNFSLEHFRFCGVNTDICVLKTVRGLREKIDDCRLELAFSACASENEIGAAAVGEFARLACNLI